MDRLVAMQIYRAVVDSGSFGRAAQLLRISTASTSRNVSELERHLGVTLLRRSSRSLMMTEAGETYYQQCCDILERIAAAEQVTAQGKAALQGELRISMPTSFGARHIAPLLPQFRERYPDIRLDAWCSDQFIDFGEDNFDVAIRIAQQVHTGLIARKLATVRCVVSASPDYLDRRGTPTVPQDLRRHDCLAYAYASHGDSWRFTKHGVAHVVPVRSAFRSNNGEVVRHACLGGAGIAVQPDFLIEDDLRSGALVPLLTDYRLAVYNVYGVYPVDGRNSARTRTFVEFLRSAFDATFAACAA